MDRVPVLLLDMDLGDMELYFKSKSCKKLTIGLCGRSHTIDFDSAQPVMHVVVFKRGRVKEVKDVTDMNEAISVARVRFEWDILAHTLYRKSLPVRSASHGRSSSRLRAVSV